MRTVYERLRPLGIVCDMTARQTVPVRLGDSGLEKIDKLAATRPGMTRSDVIRAALAYALGQSDFAATAWPKYQPTDGRWAAPRSKR